MSTMCCNARCGRRALALAAGVLGLFLFGSLLACGGGSSGNGGSTQETTQDDDARLRALIARYGVVAAPAPTVTDAQFSLGLNLFQSTLLSGNKRVACASCHPIGNAGLDNLALAIGVNGSGSPPSRTGTPVIHRNTPDLLDRATSLRSHLFWDGRVSYVEGVFSTPAGDQLPDGLSGALAAQALFPLLSRNEMLGFHGDAGNDLASLNTADEVIERNPQPVWSGIMARLRADGGFAAMLTTAYPAMTLDQIGIAQVANALAAYQTRRWTDFGSTNALLAYAAGTRSIADDARQGGLLFFGDAGCVRCHTGALLSDQKFHNLAVPQIGPGFGSGAQASPPRDLGRYEVSGAEADRYAFLTPSLWEATNTWPYLHNGVYSTLEQVIRHHLDPVATTRAFRCADAPSPAGNTLACSDSTTAPELVEDMAARLDPLLATPRTLTDAQVAQLVAFLGLLTDGNNNSPR